MYIPNCKRHRVVAVTSSALPATDTTIAYKIPVVVNGTTYYISLTSAQ